MNWWLKHPVVTYMNFVDSYYFWVSLFVLVVGSVIAAKTYKHGPYDDAWDYTWPVGLVAVAGLLVPAFSVVVFAVLPCIMFIVALISISCFLFFGIRNNFWIGRKKDV